LTSTSRFLPEERKSALAEEFATKLFTQHTNKEDLLKFTKLMGVQVLDEKDTPWVGRFLKTIGAAAAFTYPNSLLGIPADPRYEVKIPGAPPEYEHVTKEAEQSQRPLMFVSSKKPSFSIRSQTASNAQMDFLRHEIFHLIQYKVGLPFKAQDPKTNYETYQLKMDLMHELSQVNSLNPVKIYKGVKAVIKLGIDTVRAPQTDSITSEETVGKALRYSADRERETYRFFINHKDELGITDKSDEFNKKNIKIYDILEKYSHKYD
jgi:hypothetical protein